MAETKKTAAVENAAAAKETVKTEAKATVKNVEEKVKAAAKKVADKTAEDIVIIITGSVIDGFLDLYHETAFGLRATPRKDICRQIIVIYDLIACIVNNIGQLFQSVKHRKRLIIGSASENRPDDLGKLS